MYATTEWTNQLRSTLIRVHGYCEKVVAFIRPLQKGDLMECMVRRWSKSIHLGTHFGISERD